MELHSIDIAIIAAYVIIVVVAGIMMSRRASQNLDSYFLAGKTIPWYLLGVANASGMFDIAGTMWLVYLLFVYGLKSAWIPWLWPTFNQVFLMVYLSVWLRRSNTMTGAEWLRTRFGEGRGYELSHISVVIFALVSVIGFLGYAFNGIGKFAQVFLPWDLSPNTYAIILMGITAVYIITGGMFSVVLTDVIQFVLLTIASVCVGFVAMARTSPEMINAAVPSGWKDLFFDWRLDLDWSGLVNAVNEKIVQDGYSLFTIFFMMVLFKGVLASVAGPAPNYDLQKVLSTRNTKEAALMSFCTQAVLYIPRYMLIAGIGVLGIVFFTPDMNAMKQVDFEQILPYVINNFLPTGLIGIVLAGLLAAFMSTFTCTVNAGASYIVNDVYKRYFRREAPDAFYVRISYAASLLVVVVGIAFGLMTDSINEVIQWIVAGLYGGFIAPNILKWHWWRFNGYGYFAGMMVGMIAAMALGFPVIFLNQTTYFTLPAMLAVFPVILVLSLAGSIAVSLLTPPETDATLMAFYRQVRPWGFWKPVYSKIIAEDPGFQRNNTFGRDMANVAAGIAWQLPMTVIPIYLIIRDYRSMAVAAVVLVVTSVFLKKNWYDKLEEN